MHAGTVQLPAWRLRRATVSSPRSIRVPLVLQLWEWEAAALSAAFYIGERPPQAQPLVERI